MCASANLVSADPRGMVRTGSFMRKSRKGNGSALAPPRAGYLRRLIDVVIRTTVRCQELNSVAVGILKCRLAWIPFDVELVGSWHRRPAAAQRQTVFNLPTAGIVLGQWPRQSRQVVLIVHALLKAAPYSRAPSPLVPERSGMSMTKYDLSRYFQRKIC